MKIYSKQTEILSDTITPISVFLNLRDVYKSVSLFESSDYHSKENSKSFICCNPIVSLKVNGSKMKTIISDKVTGISDFMNVTDLQESINMFEFDNLNLHKHNGFFGYFSFESMQYFDTIKVKEKSNYKDVSDILLSVFEYIIVFDNFSNKAQIISNSFSDKAIDFSSIINEMIKHNLFSSQFKIIGQESVSNTEKEFLKNVEAAKQNVKQGEVFQLVISRCFSQQFSGDDFQVYRELRALNPSPYMFYFDMDNSKVFGTSPETQIKITNSIAEIHPIAGTVKRTHDLDVDLAKTKELQANPKENAEHVMLVDLARNDLNKTCEKVEVVDYKKIQNFSHVIHMVSKVIGTVKNRESLHTFSQSFPAGTLSGAPKYRAMELIQQYESNNRGFYGGAIGQISPNGDVNMAIIIRSCFSQNNKLSYQAGAGIVLDSIPINELEEVDNKIKAVKNAIKMASK